MAAPAADAGLKMIKLRSFDGEVIEVEEAVAMEFQAIKHLIVDAVADSVIPIDHINGSILSMVIVYCRKHLEAGVSDDELKAWDAEFVNVDQSVLCNLIMAANYLNIKGLVDLGCETVANMMNGKSTEEIREIFNITNDFTPEEEEAIRKKSEWAFQ